MKICVIGNSHIAALKLAIKERLFQCKNMEVIFWGLPGRAYYRIVYEDGHFTTHGGGRRGRVLEISDGRYQDINPNDFDALLFHGSHKASDLLFSLRKHAADVREYSQGFLRAGIGAWLEDNFSVTLASSVEDSFRGKILLSPIAMVSEDSQENSAMEVRREELHFLNDVINDVLAKKKVTYVAQPDETIKENKYTDRRYSINSVRLSRDLDIKHEADEYFHMNAEYGREVLMNVENMLGRA